MGVREGPAVAGRARKLGWVSVNCGEGVGGKT